MKRKVCPAVIVMALLVSTCSFAPSVCAANAKEEIQAANALYELGLFNGTGIDENGNPIFDLKRIPTRAEAVTMLVRLLGKDNEAKNGSWETPFTDIADWAKPYVGYAYVYGLTSGTSETTFGGDVPISASQYLTFILRALGYESGNDFQWDSAWELSDRIGLTAGEYSGSTGNFLREDIAEISYDALGQSYKNRSVSLIQNLDLCGAVKNGEVLHLLLDLYGRIEYYQEYPTLPRLENIDPTVTVEIPAENDKNNSDIESYWYRYTYYNENQMNSVVDAYCDLLRRNGFSVKSETDGRGYTQYTISNISTGKSFECNIDPYIVGKEWYLTLSFPKSDMIITESSYDGHFVLSTSGLTLDSGETAIITATITPSSNTAKVEWEAGVDSETIMTVEDLGTTIKDGKMIASARVTGAGAGLSVIYAWLRDGDALDLETCMVKVNEKLLPSPVKFTNISAEMNSVGGWTFTFNVENRGDKAIKYVIPYWHCLNRVGDIVYDRISRSDRFSVKITGPLNPGQTWYNLQNERPFYNSDFANTIDFIEISIFYMDDSWEVVTPDKYYDYWDIDE